MSVIPGDLKLYVKLAANSLEGLDAAAAAMQVEPYEFIFMDMQMPVMDGYESVSNMRTAGVQTLIVALRADAMKSVESGTIVAGILHCTVPSAAD